MHVHQQARAKVLSALCRGECVEQRLPCPAEVVNGAAVAHIDQADRAVGRAPDVTQEDTQRSRLSEAPLT